VAWRSLEEAGFKENIESTPSLLLTHPETRFVWTLVVVVRSHPQRSDPLFAFPGSGEVVQVLVLAYAAFPNPSLALD
jgi:hypothetical protein